MSVGHNHAELQAATTITAAEGSTGTINTATYSQLVVWLDYTKGDETSVAIIPKFLAVGGGDEHPYMEWSTDDAKLRVAKTFVLSASAKAYIVLDVKAVTQVKIYQDATGGTPTGTLQVSYVLSRSTA